MELPVTIVCKLCGTEKPRVEFRPKSRQCKVCTAEYMKDYATANKERLNAYKAEWARNNPEKAYEACETWRSNNREFEKKRASAARRANKQKVIEYNDSRRYTEKTQTPSAMRPQDRVEIERCYAQSAIYRDLFGIDTHVDHIIPLRGKKISGLHVPWNLRIVKAFDNRTKHVKWLETDGIAKSQAFEDQV